MTIHRQPAPAPEDPRSVRDRSVILGAGLGLLGAAIMLAALSLAGSPGMADGGAEYTVVRWPVNLAVLLAAGLGGTLTLATLPARTRFRPGLQAAALAVLTGGLLTVLGVTATLGLLGGVPEPDGAAGGVPGSGLPRAVVACWLVVAGSLLVLAALGLTPRKLVPRIVLGIAAAAVVITWILVARIDPWTADAAEAAPAVSVSVAGDGLRGDA